MARARASRAPIDRHHAEWLSLVETSGPFLSVPALKRAMPNGLDPLPASMPELRIAHAEWLADPGLQSRWVRFVLDDVLGLAHATHEAADADPSHRIAEHDVTLRATHVVADAGKAVLLVHQLPPGTPLDRPLAGDGWTASPLDRAAELARASEIPLALVTNGARWALVWARRGETTGTCTWRSEIWLEEPITLRAFVSLLGAQRFFVLPREEGLDTLLEESAGKQQEVADQLGTQVRHAVELLIATLDREDRTRHGELLMELESAEVYRGAVTVMMRLVFLFVAEERRLLPLDDPLYAETLAASTLRTQLRERADRFGEEVLESSRAAWHRVLALFRAVHGGIEHNALRLPAYGGGLFDPDRYPFLEGRQPGTTWDEAAAAPLPVDDRTMLHILDALQTLRQGDVAVLLSYRSLDVEQIGHVYEGLLDHTAVRITDAALGLFGKAEAEVTLNDLEQWKADSDSAFVERLGRKDVRISRAAANKALTAESSPELVSRVRALCAGEPELAERVLPVLGLVRLDLRGDPVILLAGSLYVTQALDRRASGTYYTPRQLAEEVVQHALDPVTYEPGPAQEPDAGKWRLKPSSALLDLKVADIAMGSGAFLVAACRYLAARVQEAWALETATESAGVPVPADPLERDQLAHRLVAERCLIGVDKNPMAVEMAKLSLWLITLAKDRPFSFVDHALRCGDSLLGVTELRQLEAMHIDPHWNRQSTFDLGLKEITDAVDRALTSRRALEAFVVRDVLDAERKTELLAQADGALDDVRIVGDLIVGATIVQLDDCDPLAASDVARNARLLIDPGTTHSDRAWARSQLIALADEWLTHGGPSHEPYGPRGWLGSRPLHWPLEFPEVSANGGFDAIVGNPPFLGNKYWRSSLGATYQRALEAGLQRSLGKPDLAAVFLARAAALLNGRGVFGLLATQSVTEVDSRRLLDETLLQTSSLVRAVSSASWPGTSANVTIAKIWAAHGDWKGQRVLDDRPVTDIGADLRVERQRPTPLKLVGGLQAFEGVHNGKGSAFVVPRNHDLVRSDPDMLWVKPYVSGTDITEGTPLSPPRFVLDLTSVTEAELQQLPRAQREFLFEVVRPTRTPEALSSYAGLADRWWTFWNTRETRFAQARSAANEVVAIPAVAKHLVALILPAQWVFTNKVFVVPLSRGDLQPILQSCAFDAWLTAFGGTMGGGRVMKVAAVTDTFPLPAEQVQRGAALGTTWQETLLRASSDAGSTVNGILNQVHDPAESSESVEALRQAQRQMDKAVCDAFDFASDRLDHSFYETELGIRFTVSPSVRDDLLDWLLALNQQRHAEEARRGLHDSTRASSLARRSTSSRAGAMTLGLDGV